MQLIKYGQKKHPYLSVSILWLMTFCALGRFDIEGVVPFNYLSVIIFAVLAVIGETLYLKKQSLDEQKVKSALKKACLFIGAGTVFILLMLYIFSIVPSMPQISGRNIAVPMFFVAVFFIAAASYLTFRKKWSEYRAVVFILSVSFVFHLLFSLNSALLYQWDQGAFFSTGNGHMGYIEYIYNHLSLPQFDPREKWQYYHPLLHHLTAALFLRIQTMFGVNLRIAIYNIQYLPLLYYMFTLIIFYRLSKLLGVKKPYTILLVIIMSFSPAFFYMANYINNDMMSVMFMMLSVYCAVKWYLSRTAADIIRTAFAFGFGMLTKLSVWMAAVPIAILFIAALTENLKNKHYPEFRRLFAQMWAFLGIAAPLSFYWSIRNYIRFGVPIGYIPVINDDSQLIPQSAAQRLFDFNLSQFDQTWVAAVRENDAYNEYNPLIALIKSSASVMKEATVFNRLLLVTTIVLCVISFVSMVIVILKKNVMKPVFLIAVTLFYITLMLSYYLFCLKYPHVCTEDIRYASPVIYIGALFISLAAGRIQFRKQKLSSVCRIALSVLTAAYSALSLAVMIYDITYTSLILNFA